MSNEKIAFLSLIWTIISSLAVGCWVVVPALIKYVKPWWQNRSYLSITPSRQGGRQLRHLAKTLGRMRFWIKYDSAMGRRIRHSLFQAENDILTESFSYLALHSENNMEQCSGLMFLSQLEGQEMMRYAENTINAVLNDRSTPDKVKKVAHAALEELNERKEIEKQKIVGE